MPLAHVEFTQDNSSISYNLISNCCNTFYKNKQGLWNKMASKHHSLVKEAVKLPFRPQKQNIKVSLSQADRRVMANALHAV